MRTLSIALLIFPALMLSLRAVASDSLPNAAAGQLFTIKTSLYSGQLQESVVIQFSTGQRCELTVNQAKPAADCQVLLPQADVSYWVTGELVQEREDAKFWQSKTITRRDARGKADTSRITPLAHGMLAWKQRENPIGLIQGWNDAMRLFRQSYPEHYEGSYQNITFGEKQPATELSAALYPADYIQLVSHYGLPKIGGAEDSGIAFMPVDRHESTWSYLSGITGMPKTRFTAQQTQYLQQSAVFFYKRDGEIIEYFAGAHPSCIGKTKGVWVAELIFTDLAHGAESEVCLSFTDFLRRELSELFDDIPPQAADIAYHPSVEPLVLKLYNGDSYDTTEAIDYYLVLSKD